MRRVALHIEELVVIGADPRSRHRIAAAVERTLAERLAAGLAPLPARPVHVERVAATPIPRSALATPERLGSAVGDRIANAIPSPSGRGAKP